MQKRFAIYTGCTNINIYCKCIQRAEMVKFQIQDYLKELGCPIINIYSSNLRSSAYNDLSVVSHDTNSISLLMIILIIIFWMTYNIAKDKTFDEGHLPINCCIMPCTLLKVIEFQYGQSHKCQLTFKALRKPPITPSNMEIIQYC